MEIILLESVPKLGALGEKVRVKRGFGRNYLIPTGKALSATAQNLASFEARRAELEKMAQERLAQAQAKAQALEGCQISITAQAGAEGKLFGSVGVQDIVHAMKEKGHSIEKSAIRLPNGPFRAVGEYEVELHLAGESVMVKIQVSVIAI